MLILGSTPGFMRGDPSEKQRHGKEGPGGGIGGKYMEVYVCRFYSQDGDLQ
jgi:hypothetical protein